MRGSLDGRAGDLGGNLVPLAGTRRLRGLSLVLGMDELVTPTELW